MSVLRRLLRVVSMRKTPRITVLQTQTRSGTMNHTEEEFAATCASLRDALNLILIEGKVYAAHNKLPHVAQTMYDIAEAALLQIRT
jgi:molybdopterin-guanine dinucleotide biosynthesis protein